MDDVATASARLRERGRGGAVYVFETLRQEIIALTLAPGTVLSRAELQDRFGLSSTPVRDALMRLQEEGLVEVFPQHATVVSPIDLAKARQGQFLRRSLELEIVRTLALKPDDAVVERLNSLIRQQTAFARLGEHGAFTAADQAFHKTMYEAAKVADLWDLVARHSGHIDRLRRLHLPVPGKMRDVIRDHQAIVDAIAAGKPDEAEAALRDHLSRSLGFVETLRSSHPSYFRE
jgi:DNA-binding GntR family transcriptional regulator